MRTSGLQSAPRAGNLRVLIFRRKKPDQSDAPESGAAAGVDHSVLISFPLSDSGFGTEAERDRFIGLEEEITAALASSNVGFVDGHGFGDGTAELFLHGADADSLYAVVEPLVKAFQPATGSSVLLLYGSEEHSSSRTVELG